MATRFCPNCGKENTENLNFCGNCGANLADVKVEEPILTEQTAPKTVSEEEQCAASQPADYAEKVQNTEPEQFVQTAQPVQAEQPAQPVQPAQFVQPVQPMQFQPVKPVRRGRGLGIASMVIGIIAIVYSFPVAFSVLAVPTEALVPMAIFMGILGIISLVFGIVSICMGYKKGQSISGVVMSSLALLLCIASVIISANFVDTTLMDELIDDLPNNGDYHRYTEDFEDDCDDYYYDDYYDDDYDNYDNYYDYDYYDYDEDFDDKLEDFKDRLQDYYSESY